eukprot:scaffold19770_cov44-Cyclotella_meneghiniana.AAC.8
MAALQAKLSVGDKLELEEAVHLFNVEIDRFTPQQQGKTHIEKPKSGCDTHIFFGSKECQTREELFDPNGMFDDDDTYWKVRRSCLCNMTNYGVAYYLRTLMEEGIDIVHDGAVADRVGVCVGDVNWSKGTETIPIPDWSKPITIKAKKHEWCILDMNDGSRIIVDLAAVQYDVFEYIREYPAVIKKCLDSSSFYPVGAVPEYDIVSHMRRMLPLPWVLGDGNKDDLNRTVLACLDAVFDLFPRDVFEEIKEEASYMLFMIGEHDTLLEHKQKFQLKMSSMISPDDCNWCYHPKARFTCCRCKTAKYCSLVCQKKHWKENHKEVCQEQNVVTLPNQD